jgi:acetolactate synthase-1/2/3 large subunit
MTFSAQETTARATRRVLEHFGTRTVFALAGASQSSLLNELDRHGFAVVPTRHETATVAAADGYARVTGQLGVAAVNQDQGLPNAITGMLSAFEACAPVLVLIGRDPEGLLDPEHPLSMESLPLARAVTKASRYVTDGARLAEYVAAAGRLALTGKPGPTAVCFAEDHLKHTSAHAIAPARMISGPPLPGPTAQNIEQAVALFRAARRPIIIAGDGAARSGAHQILASLSQEFGIPVLMNATARGLVPEDDSLGWPWPLAQTSVAAADLVIWAGARMTRRLGHGLPPRFARDAAMIQIDLDAAELGKHRAVTLPIQADVTLTLSALGDALTAVSVERFDAGWLAEALADRIAAFAATGRGTTGAVDPYALCRGVAQRLTADHMFINDGATILGRMFGILRMQHADCYLDSYPLGSMGIGTPLALGACAGLAEKASTKRVVLLTGDGSFGFYPSEISSMVEMGYNPIILVANNGGWGNELRSQPFKIKRTLNARLGGVDYAMVARGLGCEGITISDQSELGPMLDHAFASTGPIVCDVQVPEPVEGDPQRTIIYDDLVATKSDFYATT